MMLDEKSPTFSWWRFTVSNRLDENEVGW